IGTGERLWSRRAMLPPLPATPTSLRQCVIFRVVVVGCPPAPCFRVVDRLVVAAVPVDDEGEQGDADPCHHQRDDEPQRGGGEVEVVVDEPVGGRRPYDEGGDERVERTAGQ